MNTDGSKDIAIGARIQRAIDGAGLSQRNVATKTGLSQSTLNRIISGDRPAKTPELLSIAWTTGTTVRALSGYGDIAARAETAARATNGAGMDEMRATLLHYLALDAYLEDQAIPLPA